jgi:radical SAM superfamily enzyme YgiQ (UPF0313 family)
VNTFAYPNYPPLGLGYIGTYLNAHGHHVRIFDIMHGKEEYVDQLINFHPDFVGYNSFTVSIPMLQHLIEIARVAKPDATLVVGGHQANVLPLDTFEILKPDILILGEGERKLLEVIESKHSLEKTEGILARIRGNMHQSYKTSYIQDLDSLPFPDRRLMHAHEYTGDRFCKKRPYTHLITGRGCSASCTFCANKAMWGRMVRRRSIRNVADEVEELLRDGWKEIYFADDTFTINKAYVRSFCTEIIQRGLDFTWKAQARADTLDLETASMMKAAGCHTIQIGVESGNQKTLDFLKKGIRIADIEKAFDI